MSKATADRQQKGGFAAPISIDTAKRAEKVDNAKRVAIFELDDVVYDIPAAERADIALTYLEMIDQGDEEGAAYYLLTETLGTEAYRALKSVKGLTNEDFEGILLRVRAVALPKGKTPSPTATRG